MLLALLRDHRIPELLVRMGVTIYDVRGALEQQLARSAQLGDDTHPEELGDVIASSLEEVSGFGHHGMRIWHLLLGLMKVDDSVAGRALESLGAGVDGARHEVLEFVAETDGERHAD